MLRIAIVDDEKTVIDTINLMVEAFFQSKNINYHIHKFFSGEELLDYTGSLDLIFLDIQMSGIDGIETAMQIRSFDKKVKIFYITNYAEEMSKAFSVYSFAFIEKPIDKIEMFQNLERFLAYYYDEKNPTQKEMITFKSIHEDITVAVKDIFYLEYIGNRKISITIGNEKKIIYGSMKGIIQRLSSYDFIQPHESFIVNEAKIHSVDSYSIIMNDKTEIPIAQKRQKKVVMDISGYLHNQLKSS